MKDFSQGWSVVYTKPRHEKKISASLSKMNVRNFLPTIKKLSTWTDRKKLIEVPLFPSYLFIKLDDIQAYLRSLEIDGILYFVRIGKEIATVKESIIDNLRFVSTTNHDQVEIISDLFSPGETLLIANGPFTGFNCEVVQYKGKQKMLVRVEILQRSILMDLPVEYVESNGSSQYAAN